jgi:hypothetical protein
MWLALYLTALEAERQGRQEVADKLIFGAIIQANQSGLFDRYFQMIEPEHCE